MKITLSGDHHKFWYHCYNLWVAITIFDPQRFKVRWSWPRSIGWHSSEDISQMNQSAKWWVSVQTRALISEWGLVLMRWWYHKTDIGQLTSENQFLIFHLLFWSQSPQILRKKIHFPWMQHGFNRLAAFGCAECTWIHAFISCVRMNGHWVLPESGCEELICLSFMRSN